MPNRSVSTICRCQECTTTHPNGRVFSDVTELKSHKRRNERANQSSTEQALRNASRELFLTTLSEGTISTLDSQVGSSRPTKAVDDITDRLSNITITPGPSSSIHNRLSSTPSSTTQRPSSTSTRSSPSNLGSTALPSRSSAGRMSLQERKKSRSK